MYHFLLPVVPLPQIISGPSLLQSGPLNPAKGTGFGAEL